VQEKKIEEEIHGLQDTLLDRLRKSGKPITKLYLKDGSEMIGVIEKSTENSVRLDTGESVIEIPKKDILRRMRQQ
jgi:sRNA-binding regulator protein Hfq